MVQVLGVGVEGLSRIRRAGVAVSCEETEQGDVREETVVGNVCGGKPGSHGSKAESCGGVVPSL